MLDGQCRNGMDQRGWANADVAGDVERRERGGREHGAGQAAAGVGSVLQVEGMRLRRGWLVGCLGCRRFRLPAQSAAEATVAYRANDTAGDVGNRGAETIGFDRANDLAEKHQGPAEGTRHRVGPCGGAPVRVRMATVSMWVVWGKRSSRWSSATR